MGMQEDALKFHKDKQGKMGICNKVSLRDGRDLSLAYTPGVAEPCKMIHGDKDLSFEYTCRGNLVAVISDGTRVLGLGDIGPEAAMPVMEGKAVLYKAFGDVDAMPVCLDTKDADEFIRTVRFLQPTFAGINLEDIESPKCYDIEDALKKVMDIPVFHDDQHGTAIAATAGVIGALRCVGKKIETARIVVNGAGAAGTAIVRLLLNAGAGDVIMRDYHGTMHREMDISRLDRIQRELLPVTNKTGRNGSLLEAAREADVLIGVSAPGSFTPEIIDVMAERPVVFSLCNPEPEIGYQAAKAAGAAVAGTGRSDAPNQINNVIVFPGIFRGAIDVRARQINEEMKLAAVYAIANLVSDDELSEDYVIPDIFDKRVAPAVAKAVAEAAMRTGVARVEIDPQEVWKNATERIALMN